MIRKFGIFVLASLSVLSVRAQYRVWTFGQCLDTAIQRNISVNQTRLSNEYNRISLAQSKANRIPSLSANINEGVNFGNSINNTTNQYVQATFNSTSVSVNSTVNLFNGFQNNRTILQNKINMDAGMSDIEKAKNDVTLNITTAYLMLLSGYEILSAAQSQAEATKIQVDRTKKLVDAGKVPELNLLQIQSQQATDNLAVVNAQGAVDIEKVTLMQLMEVPVVDSFDIERPQMTDTAGVLLLSHEDIYNKALSVMPEINGASLRSQSALTAIKIYEGARWPKLNFNAGVNTNFSGSSLSTSSDVNPENNKFFNQLWNNLGEGLSLSLSIPIYSNRQIKSNIDRSMVSSLSAKLDEQNTKNTLRKAIEQSYTDLKTAGKKYSATKQQLTSAEASYKTIEKKYNVGLVTAIDYLVEKNNYSQALSNLIQAKYDLVFKTKILDFYQGKKIAF
jgi:outer membrane protein